MTDAGAVICRTTLGEVCSRESASLSNRGRHWPGERLELYDLRADDGQKDPRPPMSPAILAAATLGSSRLTGV